MAAANAGSLLTNVFGQKTDIGKIVQTFDFSQVSKTYTKLFYNFANLLSRSIFGTQSQMIICIQISPLLLAKMDRILKNL